MWGPTPPYFRFIPKKAKSYVIGLPALARTLEWVPRQGLGQCPRWPLRVCNGDEGRELPSAKLLLSQQRSVSSSPMGVSLLMLLASTLVPLAHEGWDREMQTITEKAGQPALERADDLDEVAKFAARLGPRQDLRQKLRGQGLTEGLILPVVVVSPGLPDIRQAWRSYVLEHILAQGVTHYGLALHQDTLAVVFSRRLFVPERLTEAPSLGSKARLQGKLTQKVNDVHALVGRPDELVSNADVRKIGSKLTIKVDIDGGPGTYLIELVGTTTRGPEVLAMIPLHSKNAVDGEQRPCFESGEHTYGTPPSQLIQLVNNERRRLGLAPLRRSETLSQSARRHAEAMASKGFAAHLLPGGSPPADRLARFELETPRFHENVAMASSLNQAHTDLWASPSHRRALIDPSVNQIGVGIKTVETHGGPIHFVVQHLAKL